MVMSEDAVPHGESRAAEVKTDLSLGEGEFEGS